jgi:hypothetical protein
MGAAGLSFVGVTSWPNIDLPADAAGLTFPLASGCRDWPGESWLGDRGIETQVKSELTAAEKAL